MKQPRGFPTVWSVRESCSSAECLPALRSQAGGNRLVQALVSSSNRSRFPEIKSQISCLHLQHDSIRRDKSHLHHHLARCTTDWEEATTGSFWTG